MNIDQHDTCVPEQRLSVVSGQLSAAPRETPQTTDNRQPTTSVAVAGATGYAGAELHKLLSRHPHAQVAGAYSSESFSIEHVLASGAEVVFLATPNEVSAEVAPELLDRGLKVIDLSGAFRLGEPGLY